MARAAKGAPEAKALSLLYGMVANEIELDGRLLSPKLKTFADAKAILKKEAAAFLGSMQLSPQVTELSVREFAKTGITEGAQLTPPVRNRITSNFCAN